MSKKLIFGATCPSIFSPEIQEMTENYFGAVHLTVNQDKHEDLEWILSEIDALILAGGKDIMPMIYKEEITNGDSLSSFDYKRDLREMYLIKRCFELDIPILGICRGHQLLGIYHGMGFNKDIHGSQICHSPGAAKIELDGLPCHYLYLFKKCQKEFGFEKEFVNSFHHQALNYCEKNDNVEVLGYSHLQYAHGQYSDRRIIELMRGIKNSWLSTQFHPETDFSTNKASKIVLDKFKEMIS